jgi:hypothetical protein
MRRARAGAGLLEYIMLVGLVAVAALLGVRFFGTAAHDKAAAQARCVDSFACDGEAGGVADLPPGHTAASQAVVSSPGFTAFAVAQLGQAVDAVADAALPALGARRLQASYKATPEGQVEPQPAPAVDVPGAVATARRMTDAEAYQASTSVYRMVADGWIAWDQLQALGILARDNYRPTEGDAATLVAIYVAPVLSNPVSSFPFGDGAAYLGLVDGRWVLVEAGRDGEVKGVTLPDVYTVASYLCHAGRAEACAVRDRMDERARQDMAAAQGLFLGMVGLTPVVGTVLDIGDIITNCPSNPASFDCAAAAMSIVPGVPGVGRADEVVDATRAAGRLDEAVEGAGDIASTTHRTAQELLSLRTKYDLNGVTYQVNTGHAYHRVHTGPGGVPNDVRTTGLTSDAIERSIVANIDQNLSSLPTVGQRGHYTGQVTIDGHVIEYRAVRGTNGEVFVSTYYLP